MGAGFLKDMRQNKDYGGEANPNDRVNQRRDYFDLPVCSGSAPAADALLIASKMLSMFFW